ncbi:MAG: gamma-glutamyl-gamma-aminobutyrate hydrolase family protein [Erysipelotrichaceae bacterium]|nr:gamma-glutamyl-gamma-aminobutyrate hydrolase family protein [Erysipelotrichaceae bacterium]
MVKIGIIDFVSTFSKNVEETLTKVGAQFDVFKNDADIEVLKDYDGFIFTGSPDTVYEGGKQADPRIFELNKPILGICYGHQLIHYMLGGEVKRSDTPEHGNFIFKESRPSALFKDLPKNHQVHMSHYDEVTKMAEGFENLGSTRTCQIGATQNVKRKLYTVQFHPEAQGNDCGIDIYRNFMEIVENEKNH